MSQDIIFKIAEHLPIDLALYCRLAAVNRDFYTVFTSDKLWKRLDVYGTGTKVFESFRSALQKSGTKFLTGFYSRDYARDLDPDKVMTITSNRFAWLGYICSSLERNARYFTIYRSLIKVALVIVAQQKPAMVCYFFSDRKDDELAYLALETNIQALWAIPESLYGKDVNFKEVACAYNTGPCSRPAVTYGLDLGLSPKHKLWSIAISADIRSWAYVPKMLANAVYHDYDRLLAVAKVYPDVLRRGTPLRDNKKFMMELFRSETYALRETTALAYASNRLCRDYEVCSLALKLNPGNIIDVRCYDPNLLSALHVDGFDRNILRLGERCHYSVRYPAEKCMDVDLARRMAMICCDSFSRLPANLRGNRTVALAACGTTPHNCEHVTGPLATDPSFWVECLDQLSEMVELMPYEYLKIPMLNYKGVAAAACALGASPIEIDRDFETNWSEDRTVMLNYLSNPDFNYDYHAEWLYPEWLYDDTEAMLVLVEKCGKYFELVSGRLRCSTEFMREALAVYGPEPRYTPPCAIAQFKKDPQYIATLVQLCDPTSVKQLVSTDESLSWDPCLIQISHEFYPTGTDLAHSVEFNVAAVKINPLVLNVMSDAMATNPAVIDAIKFQQTKSRQSPKPRRYTYCCGL